MATNTLAGPIKHELEDRWAKMRTHKRIISQVRFQVEWDEDQQLQRAAFDLFNFARVYVMTRRQNEWSRRQDLGLPCVRECEVITGVHG